MSAVYKLRTAAGGAPFAAAWDRALALHLVRYLRAEPKGRPSRGEIFSRTGRTPWPDAAPPPPAPPPSDPEAEHQQFQDTILRKYWLKLGQERAARLEAGSSKRTS